MENSGLPHQKRVGIHAERISSDSFSLTNQFTLIKDFEKCGNGVAIAKWE